MLDRCNNFVKNHGFWKKFILKLRFKKRFLVVFFEEGFSLMDPHKQGAKNKRIYMYKTLKRLNFWNLPSLFKRKNKLFKKICPKLGFKTFGKRVAFKVVNIGGFYVVSWEIRRIVNRKIGSWIVKSYII